MCGIAGFVQLAGSERGLAERRALLDLMGRQLARRGPDDQQIYDDGVLSLVFRRLSIMDIQHGQQPFLSEDRKIIAAVNGEIYNHRELRNSLSARHQFHSRSDCEVALHLFEDEGPDSVRRLNGMFALVIWDSQQKRLFLARDRLGIKPMFFAHTGTGLIFASELKAMLAHPDCPNQFDWETHGDTFTNLCSRLNTYIQGVEALPGGHCLVYGEHATSRPRAYWRLEDSFAKDPNDSSIAPEVWIDRYAELLQDSVQLQLQGETEVGAFLSGGLDSSLIVSMAAPGRERLHTFSMVERSILSTGDCHRAQGIAQRFKTHHHAVHFDTSTLLDTLDFSLETLENLVATVELPFFGIEFLFKHELHRYAKSQVPDLKVILIGQGADEFCGGYSRQYGSASDPVDWRDYLTRLVPGLRRIRFARSRIDPSFQPFLNNTSSQLRSLHHSLPVGSPPALAEQAATYREHLISTIIRLQNYNLWHEDRTSSSQGIEARVPFLDHRLVELLASIPDHLHPRLFMDKAIEREAATRWLGSGARNQPKVGFIISSDMSSVQAFHHDLVQRVFPAFEAAYLEGPSALFARAAVRQLQEQERREFGQGTATEQLLAIMTTAIFHRLLERRGVESLAHYAKPPSPLQPAQSLTLASRAPASTPAQPEWWTPERAVRVKPGFTVLRPCANSSSVQACFLAKGDRLHAKLDLSQSQPQLQQVLNLIAEVTVPVPVTTLATKLNCSHAALAESLAQLFRAGFVFPERPQLPAQTPATPSNSGSTTLTPPALRPTS